MDWPTRFLAAQLRKPAGIFGSWLLPKRLDRNNEHIIDVAIELLNPQPTASVLEIGFGTGLSLEKLATRVTQGTIEGVDYSPEMVRLAARRLHLTEASRIRVQSGDAACLPFPDAHFDCALTVNTVYFWPDPAQVVKELARVIRPGGRVAIAFRSRTCMQSNPIAQHGFTLYEPEEVAAMFASDSFHVLKIDHRDQDRRMDTVTVLAQRRGADKGDLLRQ